MNSQPISIFNLSPPEKLQLVEDLWDDLAATQSGVPMHDWQKKELDLRKTNFENNSTTGSTWEQVKRNIQSRYDR